MITLDHTQILGWEHAVRGMRNPKNSWSKSDSTFHSNCSSFKDECGHDVDLGNADFDLMVRLHNAGTDHRKFMRMLIVFVDINAPLYWWKEFDTYKVGVVANSCSTMHKIHAKKFTIDDFSHEHLNGSGISVLNRIISSLNVNRELFNAEKNKDAWWQMIQLLPTSYNQKRTVMLNYEVLANIYKSRHNHKLNEWHDFCHWIESLQYSELITGNF